MGRGGEDEEALKMGKIGSGRSWGGRNGEELGRVRGEEDWVSV